MLHSSQVDTPGASKDELITIWHDKDALKRIIIVSPTRMMKQRDKGKIQKYHYDFLSEFSRFHGE